MIRELTKEWIPLRDGIRLSARVWLPADSFDTPVPAILEYLPYRKGDVTSIDDSRRHPYFARHGYAAVRVDIRGSGDSEGILLDEYHPQEQEDALEVLAWIGSQPWCDGNVGMMGISWGGFNSLQVAARRPPELKAIITACSTDDRYATDVHYMGGEPLAYYMLPWAATMLAFNARPPDPEVVGARWRDLWLERLEGNRFLAETWLSHQRRDEYWQQGSICEDYGAIECAVFLVGGWADAYTDAAFRMLERLSCPRRALIGPWAHLWPEDGVPGPAVDFLGEAVAWWDRWLKGVDNGVDREPPLRAWIQDALPPKAFHEVRPGRWVGEAPWPRAEGGELAYRPAGERLARSCDEGGSRTHTSGQTVGLDAGAWCSYGNPGDLPPDQSRDDALSMAFTSEPLGERVEILGRPELRLALATDQPAAFLAVRLCDVAPDGRSALITRGVLNLAHRDGHGEPSALLPGARYPVTVPLKVAGYAIPAGHRLRLAVSTTYWPWIWPSPSPVALTVFFGPDTVLRIPVRRGTAELAPLDPPRPEPGIPFEWLRPREPRFEVLRDVPARRVVIDSAWEFFGGRRLPTGLEYDYRDPVGFEIEEGDPLSAVVTTGRTIAMGRPGWRTRIEVDSRMTADRDHFHVSAKLDAYEDEGKVFSRSYRCSVPRDLM